MIASTARATGRYVHYVDTCIALTKGLEAYIRARVGSGHYTSASEVVRAALRLMIERDESRPSFGSLLKMPAPPSASAERAP